MLYRTNAGAIRPLYEWAGTFERFWQQQLRRIKQREEIRVQAPLDATFAALLEEMGPSNEMPDGTPLPMKIEARPSNVQYRLTAVDAARG